VAPDLFSIRFFVKNLQHSKNPLGIGLQSLFQRPNQ